MMHKSAPTNSRSNHSMRSAVVKQFGHPIQFQQVPIPEPKPDEILVKVQVCGCCHTDIHAVRGDWSVRPKLPLCPGHEGVGVVQKMGHEVSDFNLGDRVGVPWLHSTCGKCEYCMDGWETLCISQTNTGYNAPGCFAEYVTIPAKYAVSIPDTIPSEEAAPLLCAGVTVYKGLKELSLHSGQWVGIIGAGGGLGHVAMQYAHALGYRVIAIDIGKDKTSFCRAIPGVEHAIDLQCHDTNEATVVEELLTMTKGGCHGMLVVAAHASSYSLALDCCRRKGVIVALGLPATNVSLDMMKMVRQGITLKGSIVGTRYDMIECLDFAARGLVRPHVTMMELDQVNEVMQEMMENKVIGRVVFQVEKSKKH